MLKSNCVRIWFILLVAVACGPESVINDVSPNPSLPGLEITVSGTGFGSQRGSNDQVLYDGAALEVISWSDGEIVALLPAGKADGGYLARVRRQGVLSQPFTHTISHDYPFALSQFTVTPNPNNVLSAIVELKTNKPAWIQVTVEGAGESWRVPATGILTPSPGTTHRAAVVGLRSGIPYALSATVTDHVEEKSETKTYTPGPLPDPIPPIDVKVSRPAEMEPGLTLFVVNKGLVPVGGYIYAVDAAGNIVWYYEDQKVAISVATQLPNGNFLYLAEGATEIDLLGNVVGKWIPRDLGIEPMHHDIIELPNGNFLTLLPEMRSIGGYPDGGTYNVVGDVVAEMTREGTVVDEIHLLDLLDPYRIPTRRDFDNPFWNWNFHVTTKDWTHTNAVVYDPRDNSVILSLRNQDLVLKVSRSTHQLVWVIGEDLPDTSGDDGWPFLHLVGEGMLPRHQHSPELLANGNILVYDDRDERPPLADTSRAVEYAIDESRMEVSQVWDWWDTSYDPPLWAIMVGDANRLAGGNVLVADAGLWDAPVPEGLRWMRLAEVRPSDQEKVWELTIRDPDGVTPYYGYRAERIRSLYPPIE